MIVYGDPSHDEALNELVARLRACLAAVQSHPDGRRTDLDALCALLIRAGELEQAAEDGLSRLLRPAAAARIIMALQRATDHAAVAFHSAWAATQRDNGPCPRDVRFELTRMARLLSELGDVPTVRLTVKVPEGFAFYGLFPDAYCAATRHWLADHAAVEPRRALVVGIRSIGTTLSSAVAATLTAAGWGVRRLTVRPTGHPFARLATLPFDGLPASAQALIVDEGPGLSGSSMAAVGEALERAGIERHRISALPAHDRGPGCAGSEAVRAWWSETPRYVAPLAELRWEGRSLPDLLRAATAELCGEPVKQIDDLSGGLWRRAVYREDDAWPAVCAAFERPTYRCTTPRGAVRWTFAGLAAAPGAATTLAEGAISRLAARAEAGWTAPPLGTSHGFVATGWISGTPLTAAGADDAVLERLACYIADAAGAPLTAAELVTSVERLREMLFWNTWESLGEAAAERTRALGETVLRLLPECSPRRYGDGRLAPHEWLRAGDGRMLKADAAGHEIDHTVIGRQPLTWDLAGALVEWELGGDAETRLLAAFADAGGGAGPPAVLRFHRLAYAAFRAGQTALCAGMTADPTEQERLWHAHARYRDELRRLLELDGPVRVCS